MSLLNLSRLAWDLEHKDGLLADYERDPDAVLETYRIGPRHARAVKDRDAAALLAEGLNPVVLRNLLVMLGVPHAQLYDPPA